MGRKRKSEGAADSNPPKRVRKPNFNADFLFAVESKLPQRVMRAVNPRMCNSWQLERIVINPSIPPSTVLALVSTHRNTTADSGYRKEAIKTWDEHALILTLRL